jgi:hypothetical protein
VILVTGKGEAHAQAAAEARQTIAFYASTPAYRGVLAHHGWAEVGERLSRLAAAQRWSEMPDLISDKILETFAVVADHAAVAERLRRRYEDLLDRIAPYHPFDPDDPLWPALRRPGA